MAPQIPHASYVSSAHSKQGHFSGHVSQMLTANASLASLSSGGSFRRSR